MKKIIAIATSLAIIGMASPVFGVTVEELQTQIAALLAQVSALQAQLTALGGAPAGVPAACSGITFTRNLTVGSSGTDVKCLQALLNTDAATQVAATGVGSTGNETTYFGPLTKAAVVKLQVKYAADILTPLGLTAGTGYVGSSTRTKLTALLAVAPPTACTADADCPTGQVCTAGACVTPPPVACEPAGGEGTYTVTLAASPAGGTVSTYAGVPVYGVDIKAVGSDIIIARLDLQAALTSDDTTLNPATFVTKVAIYDGDTMVTEKAIGAADVILDSSGNYYIRMIGFSFKVPKDTTKTLTVKVDTTTSFDVARVLAVNVYGSGIRGRDCAGIDVTTTLATTRQYTFNVPGRGTLTGSVSVDNPRSNNVEINATDGVKNVPLIVFNLKSTVGDTTLTRLSVNVSTGTSNAVPSIIYLYDGDTMVASADPSTGVGIGTFENFRLAVAKDTTKKMTIKADFSALTAQGTNTVAANIPPMTTGTTSRYERTTGAVDNTNITTAIAANTQYLYEQGTKITFVSGTNTVSTNGLGHATATGVLTFKVEPFGGTMTKPTYATAVSGATNQITVLAYTAAGAVYTTGASRVVTTSPDQNIPDGGSATVTITMLATDDGTTDVGLMRFKAEEIYWEVGTVISQQGYGTGNLTDNWKTPYANLGG